MSYQARRGYCYHPRARGYCYRPGGYCYRPGMRGGMGATSEDVQKWATYGAIAAGVGFVGWLIVRGVKSHERMVDRIAAKEGSSGVLKLRAGEAAIGLGSMLASDAISRRYRKNPKKRRSRRHG